MSPVDLYSLLTKAIHEPVLKPGDEDFQRHNGSYFSAFQNETTPAYIVRPTSTTEVQALIKAIRPSLLRKETRLAIRGNGHTPFAGASNIQDGVTIDLRGMKGVSVHKSENLVTIAAGETWLSVYTELEKHKLTTAGGRVARVGVSGLLLGGGLSFYSTRRGFACDSVTDFEVVTAAGDIVHANAHENPDLYVALKGGLCNFGIVTSFTMRTFSSQEIWGGVMYYMPETFPSLAQNACDFAHQDADADAHLIFSIGSAPQGQGITCCMYSTKGVENPPALEPFMSVEPQIKQLCTMRTGEQSDFCHELSITTTDGNRQLYMTCTIRADTSLMILIQEKWQQTLSRIKETDGLHFVLNFQPLTKTLLLNSERSGGNATGISSGDGPLFIILLNWVWESASEDDRMIAEGTALMDEFKKLASERSLLHRYLFPNYAYRTQDAIEGYGPDMKNHLRATSRQWDPEGIFQSGVPGGFKLSQI